MKLLRVKSLLLLAFILLSAQTVLAIDSVPYFNWTGPYVGLHLGYGWGNADTNLYPLPNANTFGALPATVSPGPSGVQGGIQAGYNYQMGCFVAGIEADFSGSGMSATRTISPVIGASGAAIPGAITSHQEINWFGTLRPRLGFTVTPSVLVYGTGGLAYGNVSSSANTDFRPLLPYYFPASSSSTQVGWTAGGGVEWAFAKCWTAKLEYLYMDLGSHTAVAGPTMALPAPSPLAGYKWQATSNIISFGVNYKF